jgi:hypothetical protein
MRPVGSLFAAAVFAAVVPYSVLAFAEREPATEADVSDRRMWGKTVEGLSLSIITKKNEYASGETIVLNVLLKNAGKKNVLLIEERPLWSYRPTVLGPDGKKRPIIINGKTVAEDDLGSISSMGMVLKPGEIRCVEFVMNKLYDFSRSGKYIVSVRRLHFAPAAHSPVEPSKSGKSTRVFGRASEPEGASVSSNKLVIFIDGSLPRPEDSSEKPVEEYVGIKTAEIKRIEDFMRNPSNRADDAKWLGNKKSAKAVHFLAWGIECILGGEWSSSSADKDLPAICYALGQIGDPTSFSAVRKACDHLSSSLPNSASRSAIPDLFMAYHGMAMLGHKKEALAELTRIYEKHGAKMEPARRTEYEKQLAAAATW